MHDGAAQLATLGGLVHRVSTIVVSFMTFLYGYRGTCLFVFQDVISL